MQAVKKYKVVLSIAGSDSGGGAGIQADIKAISACGCFAATAITAVTAQNTLGVADVAVMPAEIVRKQIEAVVEDIGADAVKIGMLPSAGIVDAVAGAIEKYGLINIVLDPVMVSTSGHTLVENSVAGAIVSRLFPLATLVTPNIMEAAFLSGGEIRSEDDLKKTAGLLLKKGCRAVLLKTGHLSNEVVTDMLYEKDAEKETSYPHPRIATPNTHGTGCTLSSAIAAFLACGFELPEAVRRAEEYVYEAIMYGAEYQTGSGHGPVHHFYNHWR